MKSTDKEQRWIERLRKVVKAQPSTLWVFVASNSIYVMKRNAEDEKAMAADVFDPGFDVEYVVENLGQSDWDGGDW